MFSYVWSNMLFVVYCWLFLQVLSPVGGPGLDTVQMTERRWTETKPQILLSLHLSHLSTCLHLSHHLSHLSAPVSSPVFTCLTSTVQVKSEPSSRVTLVCMVLKLSGFLAGERAIRLVDDRWLVESSPNEVWAWLCDGPPSPPCGHKKWCHISHCFVNLLFKNCFFLCIFIFYLFRCGVGDGFRDWLLWLTWLCRHGDSPERQWRHSCHGD